MRNPESGTAAPLWCVTLKFVVRQTEGQGSADDDGAIAAMGAATGPAVRGVRLA
jgi:hypothetical protein